MISQASDRRSFLRSFVVGSTLMPALINDLLADSNKRDPLSPKILNSLQKQKMSFSYS